MTSLPYAENPAQENSDPVVREAFTRPVDHFTELFGDRQHSHGQVLVGWNPKTRPAWFKLNQEVAREHLSRWTDNPDAFFTPNIFYGWRLTRLLSQLTSFYIDFDFHRRRKVDFCFEVAQVIDKIERQHWPEPNFIAYTGRGFHVYWLIEPTPAGALPRWQAVQRQLVKTLEADRMVVDCTRLMRIIGTRNSKADNVLVRGEWLHGRRYPFDWFCDEVLPFSRAEIRDIRVARAKDREQAHKSIPKTIRGSIYQRWYRVYQDLLRICEYYWFGGIETGYRDQMLFHMVNALSWFTVADALPDEICALQQTWMPNLTQKEALSYCSSVISRARASQAGEEERRYKYRRQTLWEQFEPLIPDDLLPSMRAIIPDDLAQQREAERQASRDRAAEGRWQKAQAKGDNLKNRNRKIRKLAGESGSDGRR